VGQEPIARTLKNAISSDRTAHAYLFCGTRGVGKTSMARIFARELNRSNELTQGEEISEAILRGDDLDVIEIDGASNRGVQEARDLIASAGLAPSRCPYRIYIIDEVHMLTTPAFNALLKTMEEPPSHVKFILCTTEPHKVPATIQSRCQRFDFKAISSKQIADHLHFILEQEGIEADPEVVAQVARLGNGSMRDALSLLDRLLAGGATTIKIDEMEELLGLPSQTAIFQLCEAIAKSNLESAFVSADSLISSGIALDRVLEVVANSMRNALVSKVCGSDTPLLELSDSARDCVSKVASLLDEGKMTYMIALCDASSRQVRRGGSGRALFDATIARLSMSAELAEAGSILSSDSQAAKIKKKRVVPKERVAPVVQSPIPKEKQGVPRETNWAGIKTFLSSTPGLKRIAHYLELISLENQKLHIRIAESGCDSVNYILGQRQRIEQVLSKEFGGTFSVVIESSSDSAQKTTETMESFEVVQDDELVQAARGLFDGTIVQVKSIEKEKE
jgi:DNA polymerase III subunit gamma/tau